MSGDREIDALEIAAVLETNRFRLRAAADFPDPTAQRSTFRSVALEVVDRLRLDRRPIAVPVVVVHRPHLARNLGERTLWCLAWCDCGWCGTTQEAAGSAVSACIRRALVEYRKHVEDETKAE